MYKTTTAFIGVLIAVMVSFNGVLAGYTSSMFSVLVVHAVGLSAVGIIVLCKKESTGASGKIPVYFFCAGAIGVLLTYFNNVCLGALGISLTLALGLVGQSILSCIIDHWGLLGIQTSRFSSKKLVGFALIFIGAAVMALF